MADFKCGRYWAWLNRPNWHEQIKRVFPDAEPVELPLEHPIFHCVFDLKAKPQSAWDEQWHRRRTTYERGETRTDRYRATLVGPFMINKGRIMALECANTDWAISGARRRDEEYFHLFSEKQAYPMGN